MSVLNSMHIASSLCVLLMFVMPIDSYFQADGFYLGCFRKITEAIALTSPNADPQSCNTFCSLSGHPLSGQFSFFAVDNTGLVQRLCYCINSEYDIRKDFVARSLCLVKCKLGQVANADYEEICQDNTYSVYSPCSSGTWGPNFYCKSNCDNCNISPPPFDNWRFCRFDGTCLDGCATLPCNTLFECDFISSVPDVSQLVNFQDVWRNPEAVILLPNLRVSQSGTILKAVQITASPSYPYLVIFRNMTTNTDKEEQWMKVEEIPTVDNLPRTHLYLDRMDGLGKFYKAVQVGDIIGVAWNLSAFVQWPSYVWTQHGGYRYTVDKHIARPVLQKTGWDMSKIGSAQTFSYALQPLAFAIAVHIGCDCPENCYMHNCQRNGECLHCNPGYYGTHCELTCDEGRFGADCREVCSLNCVNQRCDYMTGECLQGCTAGFLGAHCQKVCPTGWYGNNCTSLCGRCKGGVPCTPQNGQCQTGCQVWFNPPFCLVDLVCPSGMYGMDCSQPCGHCKNVSCNVRRGNCSCKEYFYGSGCLSECGMCLAGDPCLSVDGSCPRGCAPFYTGVKCTDLKVCPPGFYGPNCSDPCGNCLNAVCHIINGSCVNGCVGNWLPPKCTDRPPAPQNLEVLTCPKGIYGTSCQESCGQCQFNECDPVSGTCSYGCEGPYLPPMCQASCIDRQYGDNCIFQCGHCLNGKCQPDDGLCVAGCMPGWSGPKCLDICAIIQQGGFWNTLTSWLPW